MDNKNVKHVLFERETKDETAKEVIFFSAVRYVNVFSKTIWDDAFFEAKVSEDGIYLVDGNDDTIYINKEQIPHLKTILAFCEKMGENNEQS